MRRLMWTLAAVACGAAGGWLLGTDEYRAAAIVEITPTSPKILFAQDDAVTARIAFTRAAAESHAARATSRRMIQMALDSSDWTRALPDGPHIPADALQQRVAVRLSGETPYHIGFEYVHADPKVASAVVNAIVNTYVAECARERAPEVSLRDRLEETRVEFVTRLRELREREQAVSGGLGARFIQTDCERRTRALEDLKAQLTLLDNLLAEEADDAQRQRLERRRTALAEQQRAAREALDELQPRHDDLLEIQAAQEQAAKQLRAVQGRLAELKTVAKTWKDEAGPIRVVTPATPPTEPASSNRVEMAILGALIGLVLGGGYATTL